MQPTCTPRHHVSLAASPDDDRRIRRRTAAADSLENIDLDAMLGSLRISTPTHAKSTQDTLVQAQQPASSQIEQASQRTFASMDRRIAHGGEIGPRETDCHEPIIVLEHGLAIAQVAQPEDVELGPGTTRHCTLHNSSNSKSFHLCFSHPHGQSPSLALREHTNTRPNGRCQKDQSCHGETQKRRIVTEK